jgi:putative membrane protein
MIIGGTDVLALVADAMFVAATAWYAFALRRLRRRGRSWSGLATSAFVGGVLALFVAVGSRLGVVAEEHFPAHVLQHILLMMVGPPLIVLGRPAALFMQSASRRWQSAGARLLRSQPLSVLTGGPVATMAYFAFMWVYFLTPLYAWSAESPVLHVATHVACVALGLAYWEYVAGRDGSRAQRPQRRHPARSTEHVRRLAAVVIGMPAEMYLGLALRSHGSPLGPGTTVTSVQAGGQLFWWLAMLLSGIALAAVVGEWVVADERAARRLDAAAARAAAPAVPVAPHASGAPAEIAEWADETWQPAPATRMSE